MTDHGKQPFVFDIEETTETNTLFRDTLWTGEHLQLTVMSIPVGGDIGLEVHSENDQFLRVEGGRGKCEMGPAEDDLPQTWEVGDGDAILIPAGVWHNVTNIGAEPLQIYAIYGPPDHEPGTRHATQEDSENDPHEH